MQLRDVHLHADVTRKFRMEASLQKKLKIKREIRMEASLRLGEPSMSGSKINNLTVSRINFGPAPRFRSDLSFGRLG